MIHMCRVLEEIGENELLEQLQSWINTCHTTSSEYLGELLKPLELILANRKIPADEKRYAKVLLENIRKAFT
jgi:hypothetical protein